MQSMQDFPNKMTSLGEVQRIIGLSLSKIQMGRNQRGGLPLHKNLLVATVLNKARDLYMQETMYMNYKMMTGQFGAGPIGGGMPNSCLVDHSNMSGREDHEEEMEDTPEHEEYDEDSESDVEDECDITSNNTHHKHNHLNHNHHYHHNVNQLQNSLTSNASMNMGHASPCTSSMAAAMMMRAAAANANSMAAAAAASAASAASSSMGNSTDNENNSGTCSSFNALNMNNSAVNSGVVNNCFSQMSPMNMGMHMLQQQQQLQQQHHQQQQSQVPGERITNNQMQQSTQQSHFNGMPSHYAGMMPFFHHQQQMLLHHQQQQQLQQQQNQMSNDQGDDDSMNLEQSQEERQQQHAAVAAMASQAAQVQAASLAAAAARAAVVNNVAAAAAAASSAINVSDEDIQQHKRNTSSSASSTSGSSSSSSNDEGFIDEPECDCDTRNFSNTTSDVRVPFQYCYHCAPFHPSNGRGPTLVPSPQTTPCTTAATDTSSSVELTEAHGLLSTNSCGDSDSLKSSTCSIKQNSSVTSEESQHLTNSNENITEQCTKLPIKVSEESSTTSLGSHLSTASNGRNDTNNNSPSAGENNFTIYDMDSKSTERRSPCEFPATLRGTKRRRISGCETQDSLSMIKDDSETINNLPIPNKRRRRSDGEDEEEERSSTSSEDGDSSTTEENLSLKDTSLTLNDSGYHGEICKNEVSHPAFRSSVIESTSPNRNCVNGQPSMEIDQITSLVSIFSFGQHIMAAQQRAASSANNSSTTTLPSSVTSLTSPILSTVASSCLTSSLNESAIQLMSTNKDKIENNEEDDEEDNAHKDLSSEQKARRIRRRGSKKKMPTNDASDARASSDSESDTSSDSGHSSDDHDNSSEDKSSDTADDKSDEDISSTEALNGENEPEEKQSDILVSQLSKRSLASPSPTSEPFSCGGEKNKTSSPCSNVPTDTCVQVASV